MSDDKSPVFIYPSYFDGKGGQEVTLERAMELLEISPIIRRFRTWAVTTYGVECLVIPYFFEFARVDEPDWISHMGQKSWVNIVDFVCALEVARKIHASRNRKNKKIKVSRTVRFRILARDNFTCQSCGAKSVSGATLEIDHKLPRAKGGTNDEKNLWTLCHECNHGKRDKIFTLITKGETE